MKEKSVKAILGKIETATSGDVYTRWNKRNRRVELIVDSHVFHEAVSYREAAAMAIVVVAEQEGIKVAPRLMRWARYETGV